MSLLLLATLLVNPFVPVWITAAVLFNGRMARLRFLKAIIGN